MNPEPTTVIVALAFVFVCGVLIGRLLRWRATPAPEGVWDALDRHLAEPVDEEPVDHFALWTAELACRPRIAHYERRMDGAG